MRKLVAGMFLLIAAILLVFAGYTFVALEDVLAGFFVLSWAAFFTAAWWGWKDYSHPEWVTDEEVLEMRIQEYEMHDDLP